MIFWFSGTGNSQWLAQCLQEATKEQAYQITHDLICGETTFTLKNNERIGFVFPIHGWNIPDVVRRFIKDLTLANYRENYMYFACTCGDDMGYADEVIEKALGRKFDAAFSVLMPDVYVCLPGFDVDSKEECKEKFAKEKEMVPEIAACVRERKQIRRLKRGSFPWTKTYIIRPLFNRYLVTDKYFRVDASRCISCGRCSKMCPVGNIIVDEIPQWHSHCTGCLACYHACPHHAINFGKMTQKKGQYNLMKQLYE